MTLIKRAAKAIGRCLKFRRQVQTQSLLNTHDPILDDSTTRIEELDASIDPMLASELTAGNEPAEPSLEEAIEKVSDELLALDPDRVSESGTADEVGKSLSDQSEQTLTAQADSAPAAPEPITYAAEPAKMVEAVFSPAPAGPAVEDLSTMNLEQVRPAVELKPSKSSVSFTQMYELISGEVGKRTDAAVEVYERLLAAHRRELESSRKSTNLAWSIGGVMTAVAALGGIWSATEIGATRNEVGALKQQVASAQQASLERERVSSELLKLSQTSARIEIETLKARLDQALAVSSERDRLRGELADANRARYELEADLKIARAQSGEQLQKVSASPATQPVSMLRSAPAALADKPLAIAEKVDPTDNAIRAAHAVGSERSDVWSTLLNGR